MAENVEFPYMTDWIEVVEAGGGTYAQFTKFNNGGLVIRTQDEEESTTIVLFLDEVRRLQAWFAAYTTEE